MVLEVRLLGERSDHSAPIHIRSYKEPGISRAEKLTLTSQLQGAEDSAFTFLNVDCRSDCDKTDHGQVRREDEEGICTRYDTTDMARLRCALSGVGEMCYRG